MRALMLTHARLRTMFASICLRVLSRIQRGGARLVTDFTPKPPTLEQASADPRIARRLREISREFRSATER